MLNRLIPLRIALGVAMMAIPLLAQERLSLHPVFGDHMVIPRDTTMRLMGSAPPRTVVRVSASWLDETRQGMANDARHFEVSLPTPPAGGPHRIEVRGNGQGIDLDNLVSGDVWLASGQSNMEWPLSASAPDLRRALAIEGKRDASEGVSLVRSFDVGRRAAARRLGATEIVGSWSDVTVESLPKVSAVAYFFAREIADATGIPIGILASNWGGTPAHAWTSEATLRKMGILTSRLDRIAEDRKNFDAGPGAYARRLEKWQQEVRRADPGFRERWFEAAELKDWKPRADLSKWSEPDLSRFDGSVWFRTSFEIPAGAPLRGDVHFGPIDDQDTVFINGVRIGGLEEGSGWNKPRRYEIPAGVLREGTNALTLRVLDTGGAGGVSGEKDANHLRLSNGKRIELLRPWSWRKGLAMSEFPRAPRRALCGPNDPASLFRGMIAPLGRFAIRGAIWYQGESDVGRAAQYAQLFPAMIRDWRQSFGNDNIPFYFVQIAPFNYRTGLEGAASELREAQEAALALPHTGMAMTLDAGNPRDIHPRQKEIVGHRLALHALTHDYGQKGLSPRPPRLRRALRRGADTVVLEFDHAGEGLKARGPIQGLELLLANGRTEPISAEIRGGTLVMDLGKQTTAKMIRYAWSNAPKATLFNLAGQPVPSFRVAIPQ